MLNDLLSDSYEATIGSLTAAGTGSSSRQATHHDGSAGAQYADDEMDELLEDIDLRISCLTELSPSIHRCIQRGDAEMIPLPAIPNVSPETPVMLKILEEKNPRAPKELLDRLYRVKIGRDGNRACANFGLCTFDECSAKYRIFERAQWAHHEFSQHRFDRSWTCHICQRVDVDEHTWLEHLSSAHLMEVKGAEMPLAGHLACQVHPRPVEQERCAFCGEYPANTRAGFEMHVGAHFQDACELIAAHSSERTQLPEFSGNTVLPDPPTEKDTVLPDPPTEKMDASLDIYPQGTSSSRDILGPDLIATLLSRRINTIRHSRIKKRDSLRNTSSGRPSLLPPLKATEWRCRNCVEIPVMMFAHNTHCVVCDRKYDAYSDYYNRYGEKIR